ncbi:hypothetical protein PT974_00268 [Cladobotryum mycophilum]|uniref:Uncharacterized protein n=1 Tax=Cladobotryum mycophilum TaxID=491253 RepID=A0ABR0T0G3_9HYPO
MRACVITKSLEQIVKITFFYRRGHTEEDQSSAIHDSRPSSAVIRNMLREGSATSFGNSGYSGIWLLREVVWGSGLPAGLSGQKLRMRGHIAVPGYVTTVPKKSLEYASMVFFLSCWLRQSTKSPIKSIAAGNQQYM